MCLIHTGSPFYPKLSNKRQRRQRLLGLPRGLEERGPGSSEVPAPPGRGAAFAVVLTQGRLK